MDFSLDETQEMLKAAARDFLAKECPSQVVRGLSEEPAAYSPALWEKMADLGWIGLAVAEEAGGAGMGSVEMAVLAEEVGRALLPGPFYAVAYLCIPLFLAAGESGSSLLGQAVSGSLIPSLAWVEPLASWEEDGIRTRAEMNRGSWQVEGLKLFVPAAEIASGFVVAARGPGGVGLFWVDAKASGLTRRELPSLDRTRPLGEIRLAGAEALPLVEPPKGWRAMEQARTAAAVYLSAEAVGGMERLLELAVEHARTREQFGRPIGTFQAVSHKLADIYLEKENARSLVYYAAWALANSPEQAPLAAALARAYSAEAFHRAAAAALQVHGGMGFTWEADVHLYLKRARWHLAFLGSPAWWWQRVAKLTLDNPDWPA